jgi:DNA-binding NtrC family response regulator
MTAPVVYIDDEVPLCRVFEMVLCTRGIPIVTFTDAAAAVAYLNENDAVVVFCDLRMPTMSGLDVLARLTRPVPFFLISGDLSPTGANTPGVTGTLAKPFRAEELIEIVERIRNSRGA